MAVTTVSTSSEPLRWRSALEPIVLPLAALFASLIIFGVFCALAGSNPFGVYQSIYLAAFGSWNSFQNTLIRAAPLMLASLCTILPARLGLIVIGNEGAVVMGGITAVIAGLSLGSLPPLLVVTAMALAGILGGGLWIMAVGALRVLRGVNETISSLLMNYLAIALLNHLVGGPMRDPSSLNKPSSFPIDPVNMLGNLPNTRIHFGLIYGLIACLIAYVLIQRTTFGFAVRTIGGNPRVAKMAGIAVAKLSLIVCFLAGSCAGLAGMIEVAAVHGRANESLNAGYGYSSILVAFIARQNPFMAIPMAILLGGILASGGILQRRHDLPDASILVFQGVVFLLILFSDSLYGKFKFFQDPES